MAGGTEGAGLLALAALVRSTSLIGFVGLAKLTRPWREALRKNIRFGLIAVVPLGIWVAYVLWRFRGREVGFDGGNLDLPFRGMMEKLGEFTVTAVARTNPLASVYFRTLQELRSACAADDHLGGHADDVHRLASAVAKSAVALGRRGRGLLFVHQFSLVGESFHHHAARAADDAGFQSAARDAAVEGVADLVSVGELLCAVRRSVFRRDAGVSIASAAAGIRDSSVRICRRNRDRACHTARAGRLNSGGPTRRGVGRARARATIVLRNNEAQPVRADLQVPRALA